MALVQFTRQDTPSRPVMINPAFVASIKPLQKILPSPNTQTTGAVEYRERGTRIVMADGEHHNLLEDYAVVVEKLSDTKSTSYPSQTQLQSAWDSGQALVEGTVSKDQLPDSISPLDPSADVNEDASHLAAAEDTQSEEAVREDMRSALAADFPEPTEAKPEEKRTRRTKAQIEADNAAKDAAKDDDAQA